MSDSQVRILAGDCLDMLPSIPDASVDAVITDPPYPEIDRPYGRLTEAEWFDLMRGIVTECRRVLTPTGSAVFILQPNSREIGSMRGWLWEFMSWCCRDWNMVQDAWWWNTATLPLGGDDHSPRREARRDRRVGRQPLRQRRCCPAWRRRSDHHLLIERGACPAQRDGAEGCANTPGPERSPFFDKEPRTMSIIDDFPARVHPEDTRDAFWRQYAQWLDRQERRADELAARLELDNHFGSGRAFPDDSEVFGLGGFPDREDV